MKKLFLIISMLSLFSYGQSVEDVWKYINKVGIYCPTVVMKQAIAESGWFRSDMYLTTNNLFGMRFPKVRPTNAVDIYKGYAVYNHWMDSVIDYKIWQEFCFKTPIYSEEQYYSLLAKSYAVSPNYIDLLKSIKYGELF